MRLNKEQAEDKFLSSVNTGASSPETDLKLLSLDELADRAESIIRQSKEMLARILLEGRRRFKSNKEFGRWIASIDGLSDITRQHRNDMLNWAAFEEMHPMIGISMTAGFEISAPANSNIAEKVYKYCYKKNRPVTDVKKYITKLKSTSSIEKQVSESETIEQEEKSQSENESILSSDVENYKNNTEINDNQTVEQINNDGNYLSSILTVIDNLSSTSYFPIDRIISDDDYVTILNRFIDNVLNIHDDFAKRILEKTKENRLHKVL